MTVPSASSHDSRVLVLSQRAVHAPVHHATQYELEDVLASVDDVCVLAPPGAPHAQAGRLARQALNGALRRTRRTRRSPPWDRPSMARTPVTSQHDLFFMVVSDPYQLSYLHRLPGWRERCRTAVCLLTEVWSRWVDTDADYLAELRSFDHVYLTTPDAGPALERIGSPAPRFLPTALDTERFAPLPRPPRRSIDLYAFGRTAPSAHQQAQELADERGWTYLHDTVAPAYLPDPAAHRRLVAGLVQRARFFFAHRINDDPARVARTGGEEAISTRFFEGAAGGTVMLGSRPRTPAFDDCFDWPDAVVDLPWQGGDLRAVVDALLAQPERVLAARATGVRESLLRHDWAHRWATVLGDAGLAEDERLLERRARLDELAATATPGRLAAAEPR